MPRLSNATLSRLPANIRTPSYDARALKTGVVHIGLGAFHRAHQAPVFQSLAERGDMRWGVVAASLRSSSVRDSIAPQDYLYSLAVDDGDRRDVGIVNVVRDVIVGPDQPSRLVQAIASPDARIVTVTVTEKGYKLDLVSGTLAQNDNDVASDLADLSAPKTMPGYLAAALRERRDRGLGPLTIISCDNIAGNGPKLRSSVIEIARAHDPSLADWVDGEFAFPATMVDRIVPATHELDIEAMASQLGVLDRATVRTEPFSQWVIEDRFVAGRPDFEAAGVQITSDVAPWEEAKLRLLNGAHSAMAYLGLLAGIGTVDRFIAQDWGHAFVQNLWDEVEPTLAPNFGLDVVHYRTTLMRRFGNSALGHQLRQIAMDGSQKLPQRLVGPAVELLKSGRSQSAIALVIAAWIRCQTGMTDAGIRFEVDDPIARVTARLSEETSGSKELAQAMLRLQSIFPSQLADDDGFVDLVSAHVEALRTLGAKATVERFLEARR